MKPINKQILYGNFINNTVFNIFSNIVPICGNNEIGLIYYFISVITFIYSFYHRHFHFVRESGVNQT